MEEQEVQTKCPEAFTSIIKLADEEVDWAKVQEDLAELN